MLQRIRRALATARSSWNSTTPSRSATPRTAPWPTACRACRSISAGKQVYFGLAGTNLLDDERTIAVLPARPRALPGIRPDAAGLRTVESEAPGGRRDVVAAAGRRSAHDDDDARPAASGAALRSSMLQLRQTNTVKTVPTDAQVIDPDIQVLLVAQAQHLSDATLYAIDQFVMRGGRLMVMVDPYSEAAGGDAHPHRHAAAPTRRATCKKLFDAWGISSTRTQVVGDLDRRVARARRPRRPRAGGRLRRLVQHPRRHQPQRSGDRRSAAGHRRLARRDRARSRAPTIEFTPLLTSSDAVRA